MKKEINTKENKTEKHYETLNCKFKKLKKSKKFI
jgi:hypothetical protein